MQRKHDARGAPSSGRLPLAHQPGRGAAARSRKDGLARGTSSGEDLGGGVTPDFLASLFAVANVGLFVTDQSSRFVALNPAFVRLSGWSQEELEGQSFLTVIPEEDRERAQRLHDDYIAHGDGDPTEGRLLTKGGDRVPTLTTSARLERRDGHLYLVTTVTDLSERIRLEVQLEDAKRRAEAASEAKSNFLANMSHELRTPLNAIIGFSEIIAQQLLGPAATDRYAEYGRDIAFSGHHLLGIIGEILDMARIEAGQLELNETEIEVPALIASVQRIMAERAHASKLELTIALEPGLPKLWADEQLLRQALLNLVSNAVKFTPGGGTVTVGAMLLSDGQVALAISDTGRGIAAEHIGAALTPFARVTAPEHAGLESTGLGLPLTKAMVERHGGSLFLNSAVGSGTTAVIVLPAERLRLRSADRPRVTRLGNLDLFRIKGHELAYLADELDEEAFDALPCGAIRLDREGKVLRYNATESRHSGYQPDRVLDRNFFFDIAPCTRHPEFYGKFREGMETGDLNAAFSWTFDFKQRRARVLIQMRSCTNGDGAWVFIVWM